VGPATGLYRRTHGFLAFLLQLLTCPDVTTRNRISGKLVPTGQHLSGTVGRTRSMHDTVQQRRIALDELLPLVRAHAGGDGRVTLSWAICTLSNAAPACRLNAFRLPSSHLTAHSRGNRGISRGRRAGATRRERYATRRPSPLLILGASWYSSPHSRAQLLRPGHFGLPL